MKYFLALFLQIVFFNSAMAATPAPVQCYILAMNDPTVLTKTKAYYGPNNGGAEQSAVALCRGATVASTPIDCYKAAMSSPNVLTNTKAYYGSGDGDESEAVTLCSTPGDR